MSYLCFQIEIAEHSATNILMYRGSIRADFSLSSKIIVADFKEKLANWQNNCNKID